MKCVSGDKKCLSGMKSYIDGKSMKIISLGCFSLRVHRKESIKIDHKIKSASVCRQILSILSNPVLGNNAIKTNL